MIIINYHKILRHRLILASLNETESGNDHNKLQIWAQKEQQATSDFKFPASKQNQRCSFSILHLFPFSRYSVEKDAVG